jgi:hypothetical protein
MYPCTVYSEYADIRSYSSLTLNLDFTKAKKTNGLEIVSIDPVLESVLMILNVGPM